MAKYEPVFPPCVNGKKYRRPLDFAYLEAISVRADRLYREAPLTDLERGELLKLHEGLEAVGKSAGKFTYTELRPCRPWSGIGVAGTISEHNSGFVLRVHEFIEELEDKYPLQNASNRSVPIDSAVNVMPRPVGDEDMLWTTTTIFADSRDDASNDI